MRHVWRSGLISCCAVIGAFVAVRVDGADQSPLLLPPTNGSSSAAELFAPPRSEAPAVRSESSRESTVATDKGTAPSGPARASAPSLLRPNPIRLVNGRMQPFGPAQQPVPPADFTPPSSTLPSTSASPADQPLIRQASFDPLDLIPRSTGSQAAANTVGENLPSNNVPASTAETEATLKGQARSDVISAFKESTTQQTVSAQMRNPISFDPRIRGYRYGQIYSQIDGAQWVPGRQDLDTPMSMISPSVIQSAVAIPGPYGTQYGPGFSYIGVNTADTPRYTRGFEAHADLGINFISNGNQVNGYERLYGGADDYGFSIFHNSRHGDQYHDGSGQLIPAAYNSQNFFGQGGWSIDRFTKLEFRYLRQDITNTQIPGQFYQLDFSGTNGFNLRLTNDNPTSFWTRTITEGWYNQTYFNGATNPNETYFNVVGRVKLALEDSYGVPSTATFNSTTSGNTIITGGRYTGVLGDDDGAQLVAGADYRYIQQEINEVTSSTVTPLVPGPPPINVTRPTFVPNSFISDPGVFANLKLPITSFWTATFGNRVDFVETQVFDPALIAPLALPGIGAPQSQFNVLSSFFAVNKFDLNENWTTQVGLSSAQRPLTLTERYSNNTFIAVAQDGFTKVNGNPGQKPERAYQIDLTLQGNYENVRTRWSAFSSWITDFSTFIASDVTDPTGARIFYTTATPLATLTGVEMYTEGDLTSRLTAFGNVFYLTGRDQTIHQPLIQIYPLDARVGVRFHDANRGSKWSFEVYERMVAGQNQLGTLRAGTPTLVDGLFGAELRTPGFSITNIAAYYNYSKRLSFVGGINNLFNLNYLEHLSLRLPPQPAPPAAPAFPFVAAFSPGFAAYVGANLVY